MEKLFREYRFDIVFHEAAQTSVIRSVREPVFDADNNVTGFVTLMDIARRYGVQKIIAASSGAIYGDPVSIPQRENDPLQPTSPYGITKLAMEQYLRFYWETYHLPYVALRYANVYGPRQNPQSGSGVLAIFMEQILRGEQPVINGSGEQTRDYIYVGDIAAANIRALRSDTVGPVNVGTSEPTSVNQVFRLLKTVFGKDIPEVHRDQQKGEQLQSVLDPRRAWQLIRWKPKYPIEDGLKKTIQWYIDLITNRT